MVVEGCGPLRGEGRRSAPIRRITSRGRRDVRWDRRLRLRAGGPGAAGVGGRRTTLRCVLASHSDVNPQRSPRPRGPTPSAGPATAGQNHERNRRLHGRAARPAARAERAHPRPRSDHTTAPPQSKPYANADGRPIPLRYPPPVPDTDGTDPRVIRPAACSASPTRASSSSSARRQPGSRTGRRAGSMPTRSSRPTGCARSSGAGARPAREPRRVRGARPDRRQAAGPRADDRGRLDRPRREAPRRVARPRRARTTSPRTRSSSPRPTPTSASATAPARSPCRPRSWPPSCARRPPPRTRSPARGSPACTPPARSRSSRPRT